MVSLPVGVLMLIVVGSVLFGCLLGTVALAFIIGASRGDE